MNTFSLLLFYNFLLQGSDSLFLFQKDSLYGYVNEKNEVVIEPIYERGLNDVIINTDEKDSICLKKEGKWGLVDKNGNILVPFLSDRAFSNLKTPLPFEKDGLYGYKNAIGEVMIPAQYDSAKIASKGNCIVSKDGSWGMINTKGETIIPIEYKTWKELRKYRFRLSNEEKEDKWILKKKDKFGMINSDGEWEIPQKYDQLKKLGKRQLFRPRYIEVKDKGKYGLFDLDGNLILPIENDSIIYHKEIAFFRKGKKEGYFSDSLGASLFPNNLRLLLKNKHNFVSYRKMVRLTDGDKVGGFLIHTQKYIEPIYQAIEPFKEELAAVKLNGLWGFIDEQNNMLIPPIYERVKSFHNERAAVQKDGLWGFVNKVGELVVPTQYLNVESYEDSIARVLIGDGKWVKMDPPEIRKRGQVVNYKREFKQPRNLNLQKYASGWAYLDWEGQMLTDRTFSKIENFNDLNRASVQGIGIKKGSEEYTPELYGIISKSGEFIISPISEKGVGMIHGNFIVYHNKKAGLMNSDQEWIIEPKYSAIHFTAHPEVIIVAKYIDDRSYASVIHLDGEIIIPFIIRTWHHCKEEPKKITASGYLCEDYFVFHTSEGSILLDLKDGYEVLPANLGLRSEDSVFFSLGDEGGVLTPDGRYLGIKEEKVRQYIKEWQKDFKEKKSLNE